MARYVDSNGYVRVLDTEGIYGRRDALVYKHRLVMAEVLGRPLLDSEYVHHIDGNRSNNEPSNLRIINVRKHYDEHKGGTKAQKVFYIPYPPFEGDVTWFKLRCPTCGRIFYRRKSQCDSMTFCCAKCRADFDGGGDSKPNIICEFDTNDDFMHVYIRRCKRRHLIDDDGVFHAPKRGYRYVQQK